MTAKKTAAPTKAALAQALAVLYAASGIVEGKKVVCVIGPSEDYFCPNDTYTLIKGFNGNDEYIIVRDGDDNDVSLPFFFFKGTDEENPIVISDSDDEVTVAADGMNCRVGCTTVKFSEVEAVYKAMKAKQPKPAVTKKAAPKKKK